RLALALWSVPVLAATVTTALVRAGGDDGPAMPAKRRRALPDWRSGTTWRLGLLQAASSVMYFGVNAFLASYLHVTGQQGQVALALTALNGAQVPATVLLAVLPGAVATSRALVAGLGVL